MPYRLKRTIVWTIIYVSFVGGVFGVASWFGASQPASRQKLDPTIAAHRKMMCGPISLSVALDRLGINSSSRDLAQQCDVTPKGVELRELKRVARGIAQVEARTERLSWDALRHIDGTAVLFVKGQHFVAVDPREQASGAAIRVYDEGKPALWMTEAELKEIWNGEALVVKRRSSSVKQVDGPRIEWDHCFVDNGVLKPDSN